MAPLNYSDFVIKSAFTSYAWGEPHAVNLNNANDIAVYPFVVPFPLKVTNICVFIAQGDGSHNSDIGIYDTDGNLLGHIGAQELADETSFSGAISGGPIVIGPGTYLLAFTSAGTALQWAIAATSSANDGLAWYGTSSNGSSGSLPSTISVIAELSEGSGSPFQGCPPIVLLT